jgi:hypothetical protein
MGVVLFAVASAWADSPQPPTDAAIRKILIKESRDAYDGNCPCPYDTDRAGRRCGKRSAYSRPGGEAPLCYDHDVTKEMIEAYRKRAVTGD